MKIMGRSPVLGGSWWQKSTYSDYGHVSYQIKRNEAYNNVLANNLPLRTHSALGVGLKATFFFCGSSPIAYQTHANEAWKITNAKHCYCADKYIWIELRLWTFKHCRPQSLLHEERLFTLYILCLWDILIRFDRPIYIYISGQEQEWSSCSSCMHIFFTIALFTCPVNSLISYGARSISNPTLCTP